MKKLMAVLSLVAFQNGLAFAEIDKSTFHFFSPTPVSALRGLSTDRPDQTESPYTVDAGHFQLEMDSLSYTRTRSSGTQVEELAVAPVNLKVGLLNHMDLQLMFDPHIVQTVSDLNAGTSTETRGFGDIVTRLKVNIWGNDGGDTALAVMPFVKFPTNQHGLGNSSLEGGVIIPLAIGLSDKAGLGLMTELDAVLNDSGVGRHIEYVNSITLGYDFTDVVGGYGEFFSAVSADNPTAWVGMLDFGVTYAYTDNIQFDAGINIGITPDAPNLNPFFGLAMRI